MKLMRIVGIVLISCCLAPAAFAGGWHKVGSLTAGGDAKELSVNRECSQCLIKVSEGSVIINTVVVRVNAEKDPIKVGARLEKGDSRELDLGGKRKITGFRISDDGQGKYDVFVK